MLFLTLLSLYFASASPIQAAVVKEASAVANTLLTYAYAADFSAYVPQPTFPCMKNYGYSAAFIRAYNPAGNGTYDENATLNIRNAYNAGLGPEVYMTPLPKSSKPAASQMNEMIDGLLNNGIAVQSVWIQVTSPVTWNCGNYGANYNFINDLMNTAKHRGVDVGIYTSSYDWQQITNNWYNANAVLWYWHVYGPSTSGGSPPNFDDFRPFSSFNQQLLKVKQYAQSVYVCNTNINSNVYLTSASSFAKVGNSEKGKGPVVGFIGH